MLTLSCDDVPARAKPHPDPDIPGAFLANGAAGQDRV